MRYARKVNCSIVTILLWVASNVCCSNAALAQQARSQTTAAVSASPMPGAPAGVMAFVDVTVVPMDTERVLPNQTVLVQQGWITALGPASQVKVPEGATRIDGRGHYLMPGLSDMHVHFTSYDSLSMANRLFGWLADGITTVRSMDYTNSDKGEAALRMRGLAAAGLLWSPRLYVSAPWAPRNRSYMRPPASGVSESALDSVAAYVAEYKAKGYDHLKLYHEHGVTLDSLIVAARRVGIPVMGHAPPGETPERVFATGIRSIEHLTGYHAALVKWARDSSGGFSNDSIRNPAIMALVAAIQQANVWNCPTLVALEAAMASQIKDTLQLRRLVSRAHRFVKALQHAGAGLLLGTDDDNPRKPRSIHRELQTLVQAGLTPYQALGTGTRNVAAFYGTLDEAGTIEVRKRADLVLLRGNPLQDISNTAHPAGVMLGGRWLPREEINHRLAEMNAVTTASP